MTISPVIFPEYKLGLVKFEDIFKQIEVDLLNDINLYGLLKNNRIDLRKNDTKQLLYHHIIYNLCENIINIKKTYKIDVCIIYNKIIPENSEICQYIDCNKLYSQLSQVINNIQSKLYIPIYQVKLEINEDNKDIGEVIDILKIIITKVARMSTKKSEGFFKISDFTKKYGLKFLNEEYFSKLSTKYLLI